MCYFFWGQFLDRISVVDKDEWDGVEWDGNVTFETLRNAGFGEEVTFLEKNVIGPFVNRGIYAITGQRGLGGLLLHGDTKSFTLFATAIWNEVRRRKGEVTLYRKTGALLRSICTTRENTWIKEYFELVFTGGMEHQPALIYLGRIDPLFGNDWSEDLFERIEDARDKEIMTIAGVDYMWKVTQFNLYEPFKAFTQVLHIPTLLSLSERRTLLEECVAKWVRKPSDEMLDLLADATGILVRNKFDLDAKIVKVCQVAYKNGVEGWKKKNLGESIIRGEDINPSWKDWEASFRSVLKEEE
ncbi:4-hydroxy-tetrahydrodipicolinate synthase [Folsomia candida]|uniref:4-hydroxy-tetrahydrodipicolinate synthase n=1 Tax=Folsomia candida TaxID=158441 RepID=A0A226F4L1_FOLCA|nr:4-hydroxy-tetrahydrodipicolinate synthase [Folsomia candida]